MGRPEAVRRLVVNADDFGRSHSINQAVIRAHREGILTSASLMMNEPGSVEAVRLARENPHLGVGLHLTLICGHAVSSPAQIPDLVDQQCGFSNDPFRTGVRYFMRRNLRPQLEHEIGAQFEAFRATGLNLDHVNGHLHFHLHPTVFEILLRHARDWNLTHVRLTRDPFWLNLKLASGHLFYRLGHAFIFNLLAPWARAKMTSLKIRHTSAVFGLLQNARVDEDYLQRLISSLPPGDSELYSHPSLDEFKNEFDALISARVQALIQQHDVTLIRYQDL